MLEKLLEPGKAFLRAGLLSLAALLPTQAQETTEIIPDSNGSWNINQPVALWHYDSGSMTYSLGEIANLTISGNANTNGEIMINYSLVDETIPREKQFSGAHLNQGKSHLGIFTREETTVETISQTGTLIERNPFADHVFYCYTRFVPRKDITNIVTKLQKTTLKATDKYVNKPLEEYTFGMLDISVQEFIQNFFENQTTKDLEKENQDNTLYLTEIPFYSDKSQHPTTRREVERNFRFKLSGDHADALVYFRGHLSNSLGDEADFRFKIPIIQRPTSDEPDGFYENTDKKSNVLGLVVHSGHIYFIPRNEEMKIPIVRSPDGRPFLKYKNTRAETDPEWKNISKEFLLPLQPEGNQLKISSTPAIKRIIAPDEIRACNMAGVKIPDKTRTEIGLEGTLEKVD